MLRHRPQSDQELMDGVRAYQYRMTGHAEACIEKFFQMTGKTERDLKYVKTPCLDDNQIVEDRFNNPGALGLKSAKIVMKVLYLSMSNRPDTLWTVCNLARDVTKWTQASDDRLLRLMAYLNRTKEMVQQCWVGDPIEDCILAACSDASYAYIRNPCNLHFVEKQLAQD